MSYTPINWQTGDTITAEKLNKCDNGWGVSSTSTTLTNENITTSGNNPSPVANLVYDTEITADTLIVTFDGTDYTVLKTATPMGNMYGEIGNGGPAFTNYPFCIISASGTNSVYTESAGTYSIKIATISTTIETSANFQTAVNSCLESGVFIAISMQTTWQAIYDAMMGNKVVVIKETDTDSVDFNVVVHAGITESVYEVATIYINGGSVEARYFDASSSDGAIQPN